jgi:hypothetical protein
MITKHESIHKSGSAGATGAVIRNFFMIAWLALRVAVFALLAFLEPIVGFILCSVAVLAAIVSVILKVSGAAPHFPFWATIGFSAALYLAFVVYTAVVRLLLP